MLFKQFQHEEGACLSYILGCTRTGQAAVVDAQYHIQPYIDYLADHQLTVTHIFETHSQADHLSGAARLADAAHAPVYFHESVDANFPVRRLKDGEEVSIGNVRVKIIHTPGHTPDSISMLVTDTTRSEEPWFVLTGDTLFVGDVGRPDLKGSPDELFASIFQKLMKLPDTVEVFPAHYAGSVCGKALSPKPSSTIGYERKFNPSLQFSDKARFISHIMNDLPVQPPRFEQVRRFNLGYLSEPPIERTFDVHLLEITVQELKVRLDRGEKPFILDVRNPDEYPIANLGGYLIPLPLLNQRMKELDKEKEIIVHCQTGSRSRRAVEILYENGFSNVRNLKGGTNAWSEEIDETMRRY